MRFGLKAGILLKRRGIDGRKAGFQLPGVKFLDFAAEAIVNDGLY